VGILSATLTVSRVAGVVAYVLGVKSAENELLGLELLVVLIILIVLVGFLLIISLDLALALDLGRVDIHALKLLSQLLSGGSLASLLGLGGVAGTGLLLRLLLVGGEHHVHLLGVEVRVVLLVHLEGSTDDLEGSAGLLALGVLVELRLSAGVDGSHGQAELDARKHCCLDS